jgi:hypothetical protein
VAAVVGETSRLAQGLCFSRKVERCYHWDNSVHVTTDGWASDVGLRRDLGMVREFAANIERESHFLSPFSLLDIDGLF